MNSRERADRWIAAQYSFASTECVESLAKELETVRAEARREALEEAAKAFRDSDNVECLSVLEIETAIRALKEKKP